MNRAVEASIGRPAGLSDAEWAKVLIRFEHAGRWIAWADRGERSLASAETPEAIHEAVARTGFGDVVYEWAPPLDRMVGGSGIGPSEGGLSIVRNQESPRYRPAGLDAGAFFESRKSNSRDSSK